MWKALALMASVTAMTSGLAYGQQTPADRNASHVESLAAIPASTTTVTNYYKQNVYDPSDSKIGEIKDVLVGRDGKVAAFIVSVGGFLGAGENSPGEGKLHHRLAARYRQAPTKI